MGENIDIIIVDDEQVAIGTLQTVLTDFFDDIKILGSACDVKSAYQLILEKKPQIVFLDIEMGQESGFDLLEQFKEIEFHVVFVTAYEEFALKAIKFSALDYLIKPVNLDELELTIQKVRKNRHQNVKQLNVKHMFDNFLTKDKNEHKITIATTDGFEFVKVNNIYNLRADGSYTVFFLKDEKQLVTSKNLKFFESILKEYGFYRIHNSTLVNLKYIAKLNRFAGGSVVMENGEEYSISKSRKEEFMRILSLK